MVFEGTTECMNVSSLQFQMTKKKEKYAKLKWIGTIFCLRSNGYVMITYFCLKAGFENGYGKLVFWSEIG